MRRRGEGQFQLLFEQSFDGIIVFNSKRCFIDVNTSACNLFGFTKEEMLQLCVEDILAAEENKRSIATLKALEKGSIVGGVWSFLKKDTTVFTGEVSVRKFNDGHFQAIVREKTTMLQETKAVTQPCHLSFDTMLEGCQIIGFDWRYVYLNHSAEIHNRRPNKELLGKKYQELWPGVELTEVYQLIKLTLEERIAVHFENEFAFPDGSTGWFDLSIQPVPEGVFILSIDITERKEAEKSLRKSEEKYRLVSDNTTEWIYWLTPERKINYISPACIKITGYTCDEFIAHPELIVDIAHPDDRALMEHHIIHMWRSDKPGNFDFRIISKTGEIKWIHHSCHPMYDDRGQFLGRRAVNRDITLLKLKEEKLQESELRFKKIYEEGPLGMAVVGSDFKFRAANNAYTQMFGYSEEELLTKTFIDITYPGDADKDLGPVKQLLQNEIPVYKTEKRYVKKNGEVFWGALTVTAHFSSNGEHLYNIAILENVTERKKMEQSLRESEKKFREVFSINPDALLISRLDDGMCVAVNNGFCQVFECLEEDVLGRTTVELNLWYDVNDRVNFAHRLKADGVVENLEIKVVTQKNKIIDVLGSAIILNMDGIPHVLTALKDISELKQTLQALQKSEALLNEVGRIAKIGGWEFSTLTGESSWTEEVARIHDLDPHAPASVELSLGYYTEKSRLLIEQAVKEIVEQAKPYNLDLEIVSAKGIPKWVRTMGRPIVEGGRVVKVQGAFQDITAIKKAEEKIRQSEESLNFAQAIAKMGSWELDMIGQQQLWSENYYTLLGFKPYEVEPTYDLFISLVHPSDRHLIDQGLAEIVRTRSSVSFEFRYLLADGTVKFVQNDILPQFEGDQLVAISGVNIDITSKKMAEMELIAAKEKAEASDKLKSNFINNISHEIRTPINGILGFGQLLIDPYFSSEEKLEYYDLMRESCDRLMNTITNIMDISMLTTGNQKSVLKEVDIAELYQALVQDFRFIYSKKGIKLVVLVDDSVKEMKLYSDDNLLKKILTQLIDNAIKFTSMGKISLRAVVLGKVVQLSVTDTGIGISEEHKYRIFDNFTQVDCDNTRKYEGTGIGLSIAKGFTELLGGTIWMESQRGIGTTFHIDLPVR